MVGGPAESFERFELLSAIGTRVVWNVGAGHAVKALNNLMSAANLLVSCEALDKPAALRPGPRRHAGNHQRRERPLRQHRNKWPNYILTGTYDDGFAMRLMVKDIEPCTIEHATGVPAAAMSWPPGSPPWPTPAPATGHRPLAFHQTRAVRQEQ